MSFAAFADEAAYERHQAALAEMPRWQELERELGDHLDKRCRDLEASTDGTLTVRRRYRRAFSEGVF